MACSRPIRCRLSSPLRAPRSSASTSCITSWTCSGASVATQGSVSALSAKVDALDGRLQTLASEALLTSLTALVQVNLDTNVGSRPRPRKSRSWRPASTRSRRSCRRWDMIAAIATAVASLNASLVAAERQAIELPRSRAAIASRACISASRRPPRPGEGDRRRAGQSGGGGEGRHARPSG